jgi:chromosome partitioning protein
MGMTICIVSQKGGVGKTITSVNLAAAMAMSNRLTMLVDCDPQGSATAISGTYRKKREFSLLHGLVGQASAADIQLQTCLYYLKLVPAPVGLHRPDATLMRVPGKEALLRNFLKEPKRFFDYVLIDTPAAFNLLTLNAVVAADAVLIPVQCEYLAFRSLNQTMQALNFIKKEYHPHLALAGILLTMYDAGAGLSARILQTARRQFGKRLLNTVIPRSSKLRESPSLEIPLVVDDVTSVGARSYMDLAKELMERFR